MWIEGLEAGWIYFQYDRLPIFYFMFGILGHNDRECPQRWVGRLSLEEDELQYGHWLRVVAPRKQSKGNTQHNHQSHSYALIPDEQAPELDVDDTIYNLEPTSPAPELSLLEPNGNSSTAELLGSAWEFIREWNGMEWDGHKGMERNGMEWNVFK